MPECPFEDLSLMLFDLVLNDILTQSDVIGKANQITEASDNMYICACKVLWSSKEVRENNN